MKNLQKSDGIEDWMRRKVPCERNRTRFPSPSPRTWSFELRTPTAFFLAEGERSEVLNSWRARRQAIGIEETLGFRNQSCRERKFRERKSICVLWRWRRRVEERELWVRVHGSCSGTEVEIIHCGAPHGSIHYLDSS